MCFKKSYDEATYYEEDERAMKSSETEMSIGRKSR